MFRTTTGLTHTIAKRAAYRWCPQILRRNSQLSMLLCSCCCYRSPGWPGSPPNLHSGYAIMWLLVSIWVLQSLVLFRWTSNGHKSVPRGSSLWCFEVAGVHLENTVASLRILTAFRRTRCFATTPARCKSGKCHRLALRIQRKYKTYIPNITKSILQIAAKFSFLTFFLDDFSWKAKGKTNWLLHWRYAKVVKVLPSETGHWVDIGSILTVELAWMVKMIPSW